jgi:hypothetical protein
MGIKTDGRRQKRISKRQENQAAADLGGRTQANSGATRMGGGADVRVPGHTRLECKYTEKSFYVLKWADLEKLRVQAIQVIEEPVFQIAFQDRLGRFDRYAIITLHTAPDRHYERLDVQGNSIRIHQSYMQANLGGARHRIKFGRHVREFEIITWNEFLERRAADA